jgi:hypothetical protein
MKRTLTALAVFCTLAFAQSAFAANTGSISVTHDPLVLAGSKTTTIHVAVPQTTDPIAAVNIYTPSGYQVNLGQAAGTKIGTVDATAYSQDQKLTLPLSGDVTVDNPANHTSDSTQCARTPTSAAVWIMNLSVAGQTIPLPVYVNKTAGAEQTLGEYKISICLPPPDVPVGTPGRSAQGAQVLDARFTVNGIFTTPTGGGLLRWDALLTPYNPGRGTVNAAGTFEARAFVPLPIVLGLHRAYVLKTNTWQLNGKLTEGGLPLAGVTVHIARGTSISRLTQQSSTKTDANGNYKTAGHLKPQTTTYFRINASMSEHDYAAGCTNPAPATVAPAGCVSAKLSAWSAKSAVLAMKVVKQPAKKKK